MAEDDEIQISDLDGKLKDVILQVKMRKYDQVDEGHPVEKRRSEAPYSMVTYIGQNKGVLEQDGVSGLLLSVTVGNPVNVFIPLETIDDIAHYVKPKPADFPVAGLVRNPGKISRGA